MPYTRRTKKKRYGRPSSAPPPGRRGKGKTGEMTNAEKQASFSNFLNRQKTRSDKQKKRLEKSLKKNKPSFQPKITRRAQNHKQPRAFLERVKMHSDHWKQMRSKDGREERHGRLMRNVANQGQFSSGEAFKPWLTKKSQATRARTWTEMSTGDQRRRAERRRMMKLRATKQLLKKATFEPTMATKDSRLAPATQGQLKILTEPESYVDRVRSRAHVLNSKTRRAQQQADLSQFKECTFHPQTKKVPTYIKRISQTMKMAKELRRQQGLEDSTSTPPKPEWR
jgi:superoxide dismutase